MAIIERMRCLVEFSKILRAWKNVIADKIFSNSHSFARTRTTVKLYFEETRAPDHHFFIFLPIFSQYG